MKRISATALMVWVVLSSAGQGAATEATTKDHALKAKKPLIHFAPADEYFGPSKMSLLGIRNQLHDLSLQYDLDHTARNGIYRKALNAETSLRDWAKKYPTDSLLARDVYLLDHLYGKIDLAEAKKREPIIEHWLFNKYPATWYAKDERKRLVDEKRRWAYEKAHPHNAIQKELTPSSLAPENSPNPSPSLPLIGTPTRVPSGTLQSSPIPERSPMVP